MQKTWILIAIVSFIGLESSRGQEAREVVPNYRQAAQFSPDFIGQFVHSTSVRPNWIGKTDLFWYSFKDSEGNHYYLVDPSKRSKSLLFDHDVVAAALSEALMTPIDSNQLALSRASMNDEGTLLSFTVDRKKFELDLNTLSLSKVGEEEESEDSPASRTGRFGRGSGAPAIRDGDQSERTHRSFSPDHTSYVFLQSHNLYYVEASKKVKAEVKEIVDRLLAEEKAKKENDSKKAKDGDEEEDVDDEKDDVEEDEDTQDEDKGDKKKTTKSSGKKGDDKKDSDKKETEDSEEGDESKRRPDPSKETDERHLWANEIDESKALQLTEDSEKDYEFTSRGNGNRSRRGGTEEGDAEKEDPDQKTRPSVSWSEDSTAFHVTRRDSRGVAELFLVNSLAEPRPTLEKYKYPMPGEERITHSELHVFDRTSKKLKSLEQKWVDESHRNVHWGKSGDSLRFARQDRLLRNVELTELNTRTHETHVLIAEGFSAATISTQSVRYIKDGSQMIWWSERSGWGHYYLYDRDGNLLQPITSGPYRVSAIVDVDEEKGLLYVRANGREKEDSNIYYEHLYRVYMDGTGLTLMDPGDAFHRSSLSPTRKFVVDTCSRVDMAPISLVRDPDGKKVMELEELDVDQLEQIGWCMPERFTVKAADGVTDLYGNMWKPFDFDPARKYPIILEVYPGPQTEGVTHTFSASSSRQQLAQIGFVVVQIGHRGGTPTRSKAYHSYGYFNLRDYGLLDKKAAVEQLAIRHEFIDIDRVGIYGHSGGGFMTATALLLEPYNKFFKVGVSSAGNHDNNIYNNSWSERYHGLKEVVIEEKKEETDGDRRRGRGGRRGFEGILRGGGGSSGRGDEESYQDDKDKVVDEKKEEQEDGDEKDEEKVSKKTRFEIDVPTTTELAANLEGKLLLVHGEIDNNVHPAGTMRLANALIKANKRFDMLILPGKRHGFGDYQNYFQNVMWEYFAEHLLGDRRPGADIMEKAYH